MGTYTLTQTTPVTYIPDSKRPGHRHLYLSIDFQLRNALCNWLRETVHHGWEPHTADITYTDTQITVTGKAETDPPPLPPWDEKGGRKAEFVLRTTRIDAPRVITQAKEKHDRQRHDRPLCGRT